MAISHLLQEKIDQFMAGDCRVDISRQETREIIDALRTAEAAAKRPAPCENFCESKAFGIEIRQLKAELQRYQEHERGSAWVRLSRSDIESIQRQCVPLELSGRFDQILVGLTNQPTELEMHRADYQACKDAGFESPGELLSAYKNLIASRGNAVPDGWKLVPIEPTPEMISALKPVQVGKTTSISSRYTELVLSAPTPPSAEQIPVMDLDKLAWEGIKKAARESKWMPPEYFANDWHSDVQKFLREGAGAFTVEQPDSAAPEPIAWESTTHAYTQYITNAKYNKLSHASQQWYKPYKCSSCTKPQRISEQEFSDDEYICIRDAVDRLISAVGKDVDGDQSECSLCAEFIDELIKEAISPLNVKWHEGDDWCGYIHSAASHITEQDAREIVESWDRLTPIYDSEYDDWLTEKGRTLLDKLNENREPDYKARADELLNELLELRNIFAMTGGNVDMASFMTKINNAIAKHEGGK